MSAMTPADVLDAAADVIDECGWRRGFKDTNNRPNSTCAANAIFDDVCRMDRSLSLPAQKALWSHLGGTHVRDIWNWNDAPGQTAANVTATMRRVAADLRAEASA